MNVYPLHHSVSFILHYLVFIFKSLSRKVKNLQIGVEKLIGKVLINSICHTKPATCVIGIIINAPDVALLSTVVYALNFYIIIMVYVKNFAVYLISWFLQSTKFVNYNIPLHTLRVCISRNIF